MVMPLFGFVQSHSFTLNPRMSFKIFALFADSHTQLRADSLLPEQPPQGKGLNQARRMNQPVPVRGIHHVRGQSDLLA